MADTQKTVEGMDALEIEIMKARHSIDADIEEVDRRVRRASDWHRLASHYSLALASAAFAVGAIVAVSMFRGRRERCGGRAKPSTRDGAFLKSIIRPVIVELALKQIRRMP
jgi:hypothetical protein